MRRLSCNLHAMGAWAEPCLGYESELYLIIVDQVEKDGEGRLRTWHDGPGVRDTWWSSVVASPPEQDAGILDWFHPLKLKSSSHCC